jgi:hypothetical protein
MNRRLTWRRLFVHRGVHLISCRPHGSSVQPDSPALGRAGTTLNTFLYGATAAMARLWRELRQNLPPTCPPREGRREEKFPPNFQHSRKASPEIKTGAAFRVGFSRFFTGAVTKPRRRTCR